MLREAAAEFQAAYDERPFAQFLFNIGACHEKLLNYAKAVEFYTRYLTDEPNVRMGRWVGAVPGYQEIVRSDGYSMRRRTG